jgi:hypothetical protein
VMSVCQVIDQGARVHCEGGFSKRSLADRAHHTDDPDLPAFTQQQRRAGGASRPVAIGHYDPIVRDEAEHPATILERSRWARS